MSYFTTLNVEVEDVNSSVVEEVMEKLGWDGAVADVIGNTVYFHCGGNICIGTSEMKQEELIQKIF